MIKRLLNGIFVMIFLISSTQTSFASFGFDVFDTIAWKETNITTSLMEVWTQLEAKIKKPWWEVLKLYWRVWDDKKSNIQVLWYHTKTAWKYEIELENEKWEYKTSSFEVFAWQLSVNKSTISSSEGSVSAKNDNVKIIVELKDRYWNLIKNHQLKLLSSRIEDKFKNECKTNKNWKCIFEIISEKEWSSIFTVIDLTENKVINDRVKVIFYTPEEKFAIWWNEYLAGLLSPWWGGWLIDNFWVIDNFEIEISDYIEINNKENSMTISARDEDWNIVKNYQWTIKMEMPDDENATLPMWGEYTFQAEDQWKKVFYLATTFTKRWKTTINVYDFNDWQINELITWTVTITIWEEPTEPWPKVEENSELKIKSPANGSKLSSSKVQVSWIAPEFSNLKFYVNEVLEEENINVDEDWMFIFEANNLKDWKNKIHVTEMDWLKRSSKSIQIEIDTEPPRINDIKIYPEWEIEINWSYNVTIHSEPELSSLKILVNWNIETLREKNWEAWTYETNLKAPGQPWEYSVDIIASDSMWNKETYKNQASIKIKAIKKIAPERIDIIDTTVTKNEILVKWPKPNSQSEIKEYKIFMWESKNDLDFFQNSKVNDVTIQGLKYDTEYFIAITTIDIEWLESKNSVIKSVKTEKKEIEKPKPKEDPKPDPKPNHPSAYFTNIKAEDSKVSLSRRSLWENIVKHKIEYWISKDNLEESIFTKNSSNRWSVKDLINWLQYYFRVTWINSDWTETSNRTEIANAKPSWKWFISPWWNKEDNWKIDNIDEHVWNAWWQNPWTWPEIWFLFAMILLAGDWANRIKNKLNKK